MLAALAMLREPHPALTATAPEAVGVLGATSFVGQAVLARLCGAGLKSPPRVSAFSRSPVPPVRAHNPAHSPARVAWHRLAAGEPLPPEAIPLWIAACPLWAVSEHLPMLLALGCRRLVALSSTSRFTKQDSTAAADRSLAARLAAAEDELTRWTQSRGVGLTILRPTMIYDAVHDQNVMAIASFIRRWGFFPVVGAANGLRQPVHADDVAAACVAALASEHPAAAYEISGGETLPYRDMVRRIFSWLGRPPRVITVPPVAVRAITPLLGCWPRLESLPALAARMNEDLVFDHQQASADLGFQPRPFTLPLQCDLLHSKELPDQNCTR